MYMNQGFILKAVVIVIAVILLLSFFNINIKSTVDKPIFKQNIEFVTNGVVHVWNTYIKPYVTLLWNNALVTFIYDSFTSNMKRSLNGEKTDFQINAPYVVESN